MTLRLWLIIAALTLTVFCACPAGVPAAAEKDTYFPDKGPWNEHKYIFIGGDHNSGTSVTSGIWSSQDNVTGINAYRTKIKSKSCMEKSCKAPQNEGSWLTQVFEEYGKSKHADWVPFNGHEHTPYAEHTPERMRQWGDLAPQYHITEEDAESMGESKFKQFRAQLFDDWGKFMNLSNSFIVEKDMENMVRGRFLQAMFGRSNTAFIFVIRHPIAHWVDDSAERLEGIIVAWLKFHNLLFEDLAHLQNYMVYHEETIFESTETVISAMKEVAGYPGKIHLGKITKNKSVEDIFVRRNLVNHDYDRGSDIVVLGKSDKTKKNIDTFPDMIKSRKNKDKLAILLKYEEELKKFCYSPYSLMPTCDSPILRRSERRS